MTPAEHREGEARGLEAALIVAEHLPREEDGTATIIEVAQRRAVLLGYLREAADDKRWLEERWTESAKATQRCLDRERVLVEALRDLFGWIRRMPDAGLTSDDPRYSWWSDGYDAREQARAALDSVQEGERS